MMHVRHLTHILRVTWDEKLGDSGFHIRPEQKSRSGQIWPTSKTEIFHSKACLFFPGLSQYSENCHLFLRVTIRGVRNCV